MRAERSRAKAISVRLSAGVGPTQNTVTDAVKERSSLPPPDTLNASVPLPAVAAVVARGGAAPARPAHDERPRRELEPRRARDGKRPQLLAACRQRRDELRAVELERPPHDGPPAPAGAPLQHDVGAGQPGRGLDGEQRRVAAVDALRRPQPAAHRRPDDERAHPAGLVLRRAAGAVAVRLPVHATAGDLRRARRVEGVELRGAGPVGRERCAGVVAVRVGREAAVGPQVRDGRRTARRSRRSRRTASSDPTTAIR